MAEVVYRLGPPTTNEELNALFDAAWPSRAWSDFRPVLERSLLYVCAYHSGRLIGFVNVAWDGGIHAFVLDTTVHPAHRRQGVGVELVRRATAAARTRDIVWLHVDFEPRLRDFYAKCGFAPTEAGLMNLGSTDMTGD